MNKLINYRPIPILPCLSKILERLMYNVIHCFLQKHNILPNCQYVYSPGRSTELALIVAMGTLNKASFKLPLTSFFTYPKPLIPSIMSFFLLSKLLHYGLRGVSCYCIRSYLSNKQHFTSFMGANSEQVRQARS